MIAIAGRKAPVTPLAVRRCFRSGYVCNSARRNHLLDVRVITVIRDISTAAPRQPKFRASIYPAHSDAPSPPPPPPRRNHPEDATRSDFKRAGIFCPADRIRSRRSRCDGVGLQRVLCARRLRIPRR